MSLRSRATALLGLSVAVAGVQSFALPAQADVSTKISAYPYVQDWSNAGLITANDDWSGVPGVQGYLGSELTTSTGVDPQTLTADGSATTDVVANAAVTATNGGVLEVPGTIAIQGSGAAAAPNLVFNLDLTGKTGTTFAFNAKDLDGGADDAAQQIAVQYRVGTTGAYTNLPTGYISDATTAGTATQVTAKSVPLPAGTDGQSSVFVRVLTTNAGGNDELVGIDDINITNGGTSTPGVLTAGDPGDKTVTVNQAISPIALSASGGTGPYTYSTSALPAGLTLADGVISGTPTATGTTEVTVTVTDAATPATSDTEAFTITVSPAQAVTPIAAVQGTDAASSPLSGTTVTTQGVVTAKYGTSAGNFNGIYVQTGGTGGTADATPGASDAIFVFGANAQPAGVEIGDSVQVTGPVSEFSSSTQITPAAGGVTELATALPAVSPATIAYPATEGGREAHEGELLAPTGPFTVSNVFNIDGGASAFAEIGLATGTKPLIQPTDVEDAQTGTPGAVAADNLARGVALDDGASANLQTASNQNLPLPWVTDNPNPPRVGAPVTFTAPVILEFRNSTWKFQPQRRVTGTGAEVATFGNDRAANEAPAAVGGDLRLATFNVLNYFPTTGQAHVAAGGTCTYFNDRAGIPIANNSCNPDGPRGAATQESLERQQAKIVTAINKLTADVVSLEEIENSVKMIGQTDRDNGVRALVTALNTAAGTTRWAFAPSPPASELPALSEQDVIRTAFIYNPATVDLVGASKVLVGSAPFGNAREPLAQAFKPKGGTAAQAFGAIVNHFKSKGSGADDGTGQGLANPDRVNQANELVRFADQFKTERGVESMFLVGDFNSYTQEDPMQVLYRAGYENIKSDDETDASYSFGGLAGSIDHVLGNAAAVSTVTGSDIWEINANESLAYQYSRYNYHGAITFDGSTPWSSSDHNPEVVGIRTTAPELLTPTVAAPAVSSPSGTDGSLQVTVSGSGAAPTGTVTVTQAGAPIGTGTLDGAGKATVVLDTDTRIVGSYPLEVRYGGDSAYAPATATSTLSVTTVPVQLLATNDFHGRLANDTTTAAAGAGLLAGAVKQYRGLNPNTIFAAAGDLIGASTFESFIDKDKPTIDALNSAGLDVSATGNHEFDQGYNDLVNRVMKPFDANTNPKGGAAWQYIAANVRKKADNSRALAPSFTKMVGGVKVGFVGAVTEDLPELVSPQGIADIKVTDTVSEVNTVADELKAGGADVVVLLIHEGAGSTDCSTINSDSTSDFGKIVAGVNLNIDAVVSGHTHLSYNCSYPVPGWAAAGRAVTERPVVSAGQYGANLNRIVFGVDPNAAAPVQSKDQSTVALKTATTGTASSFPVDAPTQKIVDDAVNNAAVLGAVKVGTIAGPFDRAFFSDGTTENRGGESTLGNLVAEVQRFATANAESGAAQIAFMNPGGLRANLRGTGSTASRDVTFKQAADVQPFANTLVNEALTGQQIKNALEQQWQPAGASRPFLKLGMSKGFTYTYDPTQTQGNRITAMFLNGAPISLTTVYSVTVNSFLAGGGDSFSAFNGTARKQDTGKTDLQAQVDYFAAQTAPVAVDFKQQAVGVDFPAGAPTSYQAGVADAVKVELSSLSFTGPTDTRDTSVTVTVDGKPAGTFPVTTAPSAPGNANSNDEAGKASLSVTIPASVTAGAKQMVVTGATTGSTVSIPLTVTAAAPVATTIAVSAAPVTAGTGASATVTVTGASGTPTGLVEVRNGTTSLGTAALAPSGTATVSLATTGLAAGTYTLTASYAGEAPFTASTATFTLTVNPAPVTPPVTPPVTSPVAPPVQQAPDVVITLPNGETIIVGRTKPLVKVTLRGADGSKLTGTVKIKVPGQKTRTVKVKNGKLKVRLGVLRKVGKTKVKVVFPGNATTPRTKETVTLFAERP